MRKQNVKSSKLDKFEYRLMRAGECALLAIITLLLALGFIIYGVRFLKYLVS